MLLWSTGFIGVKYGIPYAPPLYFVAIRMAFAAGLLAIAALLVNKSLKISASLFGRSALIGLAIHGAYLGGCFYSVSRGMSAGVVSLIVCLQPILVSVLAVPFLGERLSGRAIIGLALGFFGVVTVVVPRLQGEKSIALAAVASAFLALLGGSIGTLLQKSSSTQIPMLIGATYQYLVTAVVIGLLALMTEEYSIAWTGKFIFALSWLIVALSIGAILLLYFLLQRGSAASVSSLYYLVPAVTAFMAYFIFGETISPMSAVGTLMVVIGVWLVTSKKKAPDL